MGVHGLWKLIESSGKPVPLETLENRVLAVDVSIWLYQLVKGFQEKAGQSVANAYLLGLFHRICKLLFYRIKPIFVFDGGVPALKRKTIAARQHSRSKAEELGEKLRMTLLENLAKQEALGNALGESFVLPKMFHPKEDSLFNLPPLPASKESEESDLDSDREVFRYKDLHSIDINSEEFLSLPPDMRHDILTELKETRKENSWAKLHLMPEEGSEFSNFQMSRLLKRRAVQVGIEQAEGEMGCRGFTIADLQSILSEQGVELAQRIAADNTTKILYADNLNKVINKNNKSSTESARESCKELSSTNEVDLDEIDSTDDDSLTQNEIYEIVKNSSTSLGLKSEDLQFKVSADSSHKKNDGKTEVDKELEVNDQATENELRNSEIELEHGILPQDSSHCQLPSPLSSSLQLASISSSELNKRVDGKNETDLKIKREKFPAHLGSISSTESNKTLDCKNETNLKNGNKQLLNSSNTSDINSSILPSKLDYSNKTVFSSKEIKSESTLKDASVSSESSITQNVLGDSFPKVGVISDIESSSDSEDFIEVSEDLNLSINDEPSAISPSIPTQIIIDSTEELKDDMFSDIFTNPGNDQLQDNKIEIDKDNSTTLNKIIKGSYEDTKGSVLADSKFAAKETVKSYSKTESVPNEINTTGSGTLQEQHLVKAVPQLSVDEIITMKKDLERESDSLRNEAFKEDRIASTITEQIIQDAQQLLQLFGIPYIIAPLEAEAQCAYLDLTHQTQGTITDDSDIWLFGGRTVYKNFFDQKKFVLQFKSTDISRCLHMGRDDMIMLALLSGSDYTPGLTGVGAVTALEIIAHFPQNEKESTILQRLSHFSDDYKKSKLKPNISSKLKKISISQGFPSIEVVKAYLEPLVDQSTEPFSWRKPKLAELRNYAREKFGWNETRTDKMLQPVFENLNRTEGQGTLHRYFEWNFEGIENQMSKRVEKAVTLLKTPSLLDSLPSHSKAKKQITGRPSTSTDSFQTNTNLTVKSKTPAQIAREKAAKKIKELKKQGKFKSRGNNKK
ncbi:DNA excision repair protein ERCC-5 isoform X2 [Halyomorpha halys]|uniref:DNA excision repair protein ERCC-5 isoform X2 n=1 Tax=Halyomorpha halys TaxID=286706 RepID=UPI0034D2B91E